MEIKDLELYVKKERKKKVSGHYIDDEVGYDEIRSEDGMTTKVGAAIYKKEYKPTQTYTQSIEYFKEIPVIINGVLSSVLEGEDNNCQLKVGEFNKTENMNSHRESNQYGSYLEEEYDSYLYGFKYADIDFCNSREERNKMILSLFKIDLDKPDASICIKSQNLPESLSSLSIDIIDFNKKTREINKKAVKK